MRKLVVIVAIIAVFIVAFLVFAPLFLCAGFSDCFGVMPEALVKEVIREQNFGTNPLLDINSQVESHTVWFSYQEELNQKELTKDFENQATFCFGSANPTVSVQNGRIKNVKLRLPIVGSCIIGAGDNCTWFLAACSNTKEKLLTKLNTHVRAKNITANTLADCVCEKELCCAFVFIS